MSLAERRAITEASRSGIREASAFADLRDYIESVLELLDGQDLGLVLMLDEFDKLQEGIDSNVTSPQVPENIRHLVQSYSRFSLILTGMLRIRRLTEDYWSALFGLGKQFNVSALSEDAARQLVEVPVRGKLTYTKQAREQVIMLTARQPYLIQCLCSAIFDLAEQTGTRSINSDFVEDAVQEMLPGNGHFPSYWNTYVGSDIQRLLMAVLNRTDASSPSLSGLVEIDEVLTVFGVEIGEDDLIGHLEALQELELVELQQESDRSSYRLTIPLFGKWILMKQDIDALVMRARLEASETYG
jgi:type I restriction enzyme M protein